MTDLSKELIADLQSIDTPTVCNALELLIPERRGYGFTTQALVCTRPELPAPPRFGQRTLPTSVVRRLKT